MLSTTNGTLVRIFKARTLPKRFGQSCHDEGLAERKYLGLQTVEVGRIVASVDRWEDFDCGIRGEGRGRAKDIAGGSRGRLAGRESGYRELAIRKL